jgi:hypothetical protein
MEENNEAGCNMMQWVISENIHTSPKEEIPTHYQKQFFSPLPLLLGGNFLLGGNSTRMINDL